MTFLFWVLCTVSALRGVLLPEAARGCGVSSCWKWRPDCSGGFIYFYVFIYLKNKYLSTLLYITHTLPAQPSGAVLGSESCPRMLWHVEWEGLGPSGWWLTRSISWATATDKLNTHVNAPEFTDYYYFSSAVPTRQRISRFINGWKLTKLKLTKRHNSEDKAVIKVLNRQRSHTRLSG